MGSEPKVTLGEWRDLRPDVELYADAARNIREVVAPVLTAHFGERCPDFEEHCIVCRRWAALDLLMENPYAR